MNNFIVLDFEIENGQITPLSRKELLDSLRDVWDYDDKTLEGYRQSEEEAVNVLNQISANLLWENTDLEPEVTVQDLRDTCLENSEEKMCLIDRNSETRQKLAGILESMLDLIQHLGFDDNTSKEYIGAAEPNDIINKFRDAIHGIELEIGDNKSQCIHKSRKNS